MASLFCERAVSDALVHGVAILKFISATDLGITGSHQAGFYLPRPVWRLFTNLPPTSGENFEHAVEVLWPDGIRTQSMLKWYGQGTRSEYRLTRFGRDFPWRNADVLGSLLVVIPVNFEHFVAYVLDTDEDIEEIQASLGVEIISSWAHYKRGEDIEETEDLCLNRNFRQFVANLEELPTGNELSLRARTALLACVPAFLEGRIDDQLVRLMREEYSLYKMAERKIYEPDVQRLFQSIDDFLETATSILNGRKSRAGRSFENHVEFLLRNAGIPFAARPRVDNTRPDILIPGVDEYLDGSYPRNKLFMLGIKRTCKDRWRQVTKEAPRIKTKHLLTMQEGISENQLSEMRNSRISLVVPRSLHKLFPREGREQIFTLESFVEHVANRLR